MDHETIRERLGGAIPLNALLGLVITSIGDGTAEVRLPFRREVTNHVGGVHATAIFGVAEAASGCAVAGLFAAQATSIHSVASGGQIRFERLGRSSLTAAASVVGTPSDLRDQLERDGRVAVEVDVIVRSDGSSSDAARMTMSWHVLRRQDRTASPGSGG